MKNLGSYAVFSGAAVYDHHLNCAASLETLLFTMCISACANFKFATINKIPDMITMIVTASNVISPAHLSRMITLIGDLEPDYLIAFNTGAIWNVIFKWVDRGMTDSPEYIKHTLEEYLKHL